MTKYRARVAWVHPNKWTITKEPTGIPKPKLSEFREALKADGWTRFDSYGEATRYTELFALEESGDILELSLQPSFELVVNGKKICTYRADFQYQNLQGETIIEDFKGYKTPQYKLKRKLFCALYDGVIHVETG